MYCLARGNPADILRIAQMKRSEAYCWALLMGERNDI